MLLPVQGLAASTVEDQTGVRSPGRGNRKPEDWVLRVFGIPRFGEEVRHG